MPFDDGQGPWGGKPRVIKGGGGPKKPQGKDIDLDALLRKGKQRFGGMGSGKGGSPKGLALIALVLVALWFTVGGFYRVGPDEQAAVLRFGEFHRTSQPGLHYHLPAPIEEVMVRKVTRINREEIGYRSSVTGRGDSLRSVPEESLMLTGDENIVDIHFEVQWKIKDLKAFLFNIRTPYVSVKNAAESAMREVIGKTPIARALAEGRFEVEQSTQELLQKILDSYEAGIDVRRVQMLKVDPPEAVIDAFRDVQTAKADREREVNQAETYRNDILPRARGEAEKMLQDAEAYKRQVISHAEGESARFISVYNEYRNAKDVTRKRIYIETMQNILSGVNKVIIDEKASNGVIPYLPLQGLQSTAGSSSSKSNE